MHHPRHNACVILAPTHALSLAVNEYFLVAYLAMLTDPGKGAAYFARFFAAPSANGPGGDPSYPVRKDCEDLATPVNASMCVFGRGVDCSGWWWWWS